MREPGPDGWVGRALPLKEDARLVAGRGRFLDDVVAAGGLHMAMLRSPHAHARIVAIDVRAAAALPGVAAVLTGAEAAAASRPIRPLIPTAVPLDDYCLAVDVARFAGEPVAAVAAVDRATAEDAVELIRVTWEPLPAAVDAEAGARGEGPLLYPSLGTNVVWHDTLTYGDVDAAFAAADGVLEERFEIQRYASTLLETFGCIAEYDAGTDASPSSPTTSGRGSRWPFWPSRSGCRRPGCGSGARTSAAASATSGVPPTC